MSAPSTRFQKMGEQIRGEIVDKAKDRAVALFGETPPGNQDVGPKESVAMMRRNWGDIGYRQALLTRVGPKNYRDMVIEMYGGNEAVWPMPPEGRPPNG